MTPQPDSIVMQGRITVADTARFFYFHMLRRVWWLLAFIVPILLLFALLMLPDVREGALYWVVLFVLFYLYGFAPYLAGRRAMGKRASTGAALTMTFGPEGMESVSEESSGKVAWSAMERVFETRRMFVIYLGPATAIRIPKHLLPTPEEQERFRMLLHHHLAGDRFKPAGPMGWLF